MKVTAIHLVMEQVPFENATPLRAFTARRDAASFVALCEAHDAKKPVCPPIECSPENDALWDTWDAAQKEWQRTHPGGSAAGYYGNYEVVEIPLQSRGKRGAL